jgi:beta-carotene 3-hydroxylase
MALDISAAITTKPFRLFHNPPYLPPKPTVNSKALFITPASIKLLYTTSSAKRRTMGTVCFVVEEKQQSSSDVEEDSNKRGSEEEENVIIPSENVINQIQIPIISTRATQRLAKKESERSTYLVAAVMSTFGITSMAVMAVYYRFSWQMEVP